MDLEKAGIRAVVYDLDGTLVSLTVDWDEVQTAVEAVYRRAGIEVEENGLWELLLSAESVGLGPEVEETISGYEQEGARNSIRLEYADHLFSHELHVGVCSLNCEAACRIALEEHGLLDRVAMIVGRDSVSQHKPHPLPLRTVIEKLGSDVDETLFLGDSERDKETADRAGVAFEYASSLVE